MKFELKPNNRNPLKQDLIDDILRVAKLLNKHSLTSIEYNKNGRWNIGTPISHFGSWNNALDAAGLKVLRKMNISDSELFDNLREVWIKIGRQPYSSEMSKPLSQYNISVYTRRFGSWRMALESFIDNVNQDIELSTELSPNNASDNLLLDRTREPNLRLRFLIMKRDNFKCVNCGRSPATDPSIILHVDHIIPWSKGGKTVAENLQTLCSICNLGKSNIM
jgi:hypothetical protein